MTRLLAAFLNLAAIVFVVGIEGWAGTVGAEHQQITRIALVLDTSASTNRFELPLPSIDQVRQLLEALVATGGEFQVFYVRESGHTIGAWVSLPSPASRPSPPRLSGNPFSPVDAAKRTEYGRSLEKYKAEDDVRKEECHRRIQGFLRNLAPTLAAGRNAQRSAVREALYFALRFLNAPARTQVRPVLAVLSDCRDDSPQSPKNIELSSVPNLIILWVSPEPGAVFPLPGVSPQTFASPAHVLDYATMLFQSSAEAVN